VAGSLEDDELKVPLEVLQHLVVYLSGLAIEGTE
jgi:hypothetical protein